MLALDLVSCAFRDWPMNERIDYSTHILIGIKKSGDMTVVRSGLVCHGKPMWTERSSQ